MCMQQPRGTKALQIQLPLFLGVDFFMFSITCTPSSRGSPSRWEQPYLQSVG